MGVPTASRASSREGSRRDTVVWAVLLLAVVVLVGGLAATLSRAEPRRSGTNGVAHESILVAVPGTVICQPGETVPRGTAAVRPALGPHEGAGGALLVEVSRGRATLATGTLAQGWKESAPSIGIPPVTRDLADVTVCVTVVAGSAVVTGGPVPPGREQAETARGDPLGAAIPIDYMRAGSESGWAFAATAFQRVGAAHGGWSGTAVGAVLLLCLAGSSLLAGAVVIRTVVQRRDDEPGHRHAERRWVRLPATAWALAAIASLNAVAWSVVTPPLHVPDEPTHFAYVQTIGETGAPPVPHEHPRYSPELVTMMRDVHVHERIGEFRTAAWSDADLRRLRGDQRAGLSRVGNGSAAASTVEPPLYYALAAIPYAVARDAPLLDRLAAVRLLGATLAGLTALFAFLFVRECLPGRRWAWSVGGLTVAFAPMVAYVSGGVNPDALLFPVCAALFYCLARAFRRGLSPRLAIWTGVVIAIGMVGKINFYGLVPGALLALVLAARTTADGWNRQAGRLVATVLAVGFGPFLLMHLLDALLWDRANVLWRDTSRARADRGGLLDQLGYLWQVYLPPLPGQHAEYPDAYIGYDRWFKTFIGSFSGTIVNYADWVYRVALAVCLLLAALAVRVLVGARDVVRRRAGELAGYGTMAGGMLLLIALVALRGWAPGLLAAVQGRYLLPLMALFAAFVALGARGAGARWGRALGAGIAIAALAWSLFGQLHMIDHFYG